MYVTSSVASAIWISGWQALETARAIPGDDTILQLSRHSLEENIKPLVATGTAYLCLDAS
jgi:hypothetical protein